MSADTEQASGDGGSGHGIVDRLFGLVSGVKTWTQLAILIVLGLALLLGYLIYSNEDRLIYAVEELMRQSQRARVNAAKVADVTHDLVDSTGALSASVWGVDLISNRRWLIGWYAQDGLPKRWFAANEKRLRAGIPVLRMARGTNSHMVEAINGVPGCGAVNGETEELTSLYSFGVVYECVLTIPPEPGRLGGALYMFFDHLLDKNEAERLRVPLWTAAETLAK